MPPLAGMGWELHSGGSGGFAQWAQREPEPLMPTCSCCSPSSSCAPSCGSGGSRGVPAPRRGLPAAPGSQGSTSGSPWSQSPRVCNRDGKKPRRETRILLPPGLGGEMVTRALSQMSRISPGSTRTCQSPALLLSACSPAPRSWAPKEKESSPAAAPLHLGWHIWASQSRLQVGVHHGLTVWRLNVVGSFLELQQHGHLWGQEHGRSRRGTGGPQVTGEALLALPNQPCWKAP